MEQESPGPFGPIVPPEMISQQRKKSWLLPATGGLVVGTILGLLIGVATAGGNADSDTVSEAGSSGLSLEIIEQAVEACGMDSDGYTILDGGTALELDTKGEEAFDTGTSDYVAYYCMLNQLGVPESTQQKIGRTRALDGTQSDTWSDLQASWSYHPDNGSNVLIEGARGK